MFSCVVPVKGARPFIADALASLEAQGMGEELEVIVQDGTTEYTEHTEIPEGLNVQWFREGDKGQSDALNKGFAKAKGEWFFWLNADDVLLPGALKKVCELISSHAPSTSDEVTQAPSTSAAKPHESTPSWIAGNQLLIDDAGKVLKCSVGNGWHDWLYRNAVPHAYGPSAFYRRELFEKVGGFDVNLKYCMDWDLWIKFMKAGAKFVRINDYLWAQRQWAGSKTQRVLSREEMVEHFSEVDKMCAKNGFRMTKGGVWLTRAVRLIEGCYLKEFVDGLKWKGKVV